MAGLSGVSVPALGMLGRAPALVSRGPDLTTGVRSGEVSTQSGVIWSRAVEPGRMMVRMHSNGRDRRMVRGPRTDERADLTARLHLVDLRPGRSYDAEVWFETVEGARSAPQHLTFATAPIHPAAQSIVWSGDTCGQGWGINLGRGGLRSYQAMLDLRPDLFVHVGDTIYADEPMEASVRLDDGTTWRNELTEEVTVVAQTLAEFRGRHRYPLRDDNVRAFHAQVPTVSMWDDHETCNNWYPGEVIGDVHYTAAHHYSPERAAYDDFDPFWEFISGPLAASPFWCKDDELDQTFGPQVVFSKGESQVGRLDVAPLLTNQFFGQLDLAATGELTVRLRDAGGSVLWERTLEPATSKREENLPMSR